MNFGPTLVTLPNPTAASAYATMGNINAAKSKSGQIMTNEIRYIPTNKPDKCILTFHATTNTVHVGRYKNNACLT